MDSKKIGQFITERRKSLGFTQQQLADQIGVSNKAISKWETGEGYPDITIILALSKALFVTADELLNGEMISSEQLNREVSIGKSKKIFSKDSLERAAISFVLIMIAVMTLFTVNKQITKYDHILTAVSEKEAGEIEELLIAAGIKYRMPYDGLDFEVDRKQYAEAIMLFGYNDKITSNWSIDNMDNGYSNSDADKHKRYVAYLEQQIILMATHLDGVDSAQAIVDAPRDNGMKSALVLLHLKKAMTKDQAAAFAKALSVGLGNENASTISIMDTEGNMIFSGTVATAELKAFR
ncbi:MAG: helix-turn-helix domain-containing protein [Lachnospiraceae bacterium]|nr:helix-turn-helix domain-containing protein [Lachnospiraceae bacterium]